MVCPAAALALALPLLAATQETPRLERPAAAAPPIASIELHLPTGVDPAGLPEQLAVARGQPYSLRGVRRSIERLMATGRFADVVVRRAEDARGVRLVFELVPRQRIAALYVDGERALDARAILAASRLAGGGEFYPELVELAEGRIRALYARRGYERAEVGVQLRELAGADVEVGLTVVEGEPTRVAGVTVGGNPGLPVPRLAAAIGLPLGGVLDLDALDAGVERLKALYRSERFWRARVGEPEILRGADGAIVALPASAGARYELLFHGNRSFSSPMLASLLGYDGTEALDGAVMSRMARRLASFYRYRGFHEVRVTPREVHSPDETRAVVAFDVEEGPPLFVRSIVFEGNQALSSEALRRILTDRIRGMAPVPSEQWRPLDDALEVEGRRSSEARAAPNPDPAHVFVAEAYQEAVRAMRAAYEERGHLSARVEIREVTLDVEKRTADAAFVIEEGPRAIVRELGYAGLPAAFEPGGAVALRAGDPFRFSAVEDASRSLQRALGRKGYLFAQVEGESTVAPGGQDARVLLRVEPGPRVRVGKIFVQGASRVDEEMVRANLALKDGSILDPEALFDSQRNLVLLGTFRSVAVRLISPDVQEETKDVVVEVKERPRMMGELSGGFSLVDGPRLMAEGVMPTLDGYGTSLSGRVKVNYLGASTLMLSVPSGQRPDLSGMDGFDFRANLGLSQPRLYALLPAKVGGRVDLVGERVHRLAYEFVRYAGVVGADWSALPWLTVSAQAELEHDIVNAGPATEGLSVGDLLPGFGSNDPQQPRFPIGNYTLVSARPTLTLDFRDDFARPTKGILFTGTTEWTHDLARTEILIHTLKLSGTLTGYIPLPRRMVLALSARGGLLRHLEEESKSIAPQRFFLGGASSMRGFREDGVIPQDTREELSRAVRYCRALALPYGCSADAEALLGGREIPSEGGEVFALFKGELRFPVVGAIDLGLFLEAGNLWFDPRQVNFRELRQVAGAGLRYTTPVGPIAFDLGVNLLPDTAINESRANLHFSIGLF